MARGSSACPSDCPSTPLGASRAKLANQSSDQEKGAGGEVNHGSFICSPKKPRGPARFRESQVRTENSNKHWVPTGQVIVRGRQRRRINVQRQVAKLASAGSLAAETSTSFWGQKKPTPPKPLDMVFAVLKPTKRPNQGVSVTKPGRAVSLSAGEGVELSFFNAESVRSADRFQVILERMVVRAGERNKSVRKANLC